ncbi:MAG: alpha-galactosidase, partial [Myxococcales bacterium]|nr:alpha-galactosidase [Myxococcales bacterium]
VRVRPAQLQGAAPKPNLGAERDRALLGAVEALQHRAPHRLEAHVDAVATTLAPLGMPLVEIDDGWEPAWGDWVADEARFPGGMEAIGATITDRGLVAGVWLAPFLVDTTAAAAQGDPTRFVRGPDGQPLVHRLTGNPRSFYVVDATDPDGLAIATAPIATLAAAGFTYFKLDFLYAGAFAGDRADAVTGVEALRRGLAAIRDAAGPDAVIEACGAPILPVIGRADVLRIGSDTAFEAFDLKFTMVGWAARALAGRAWLWPRIWLDADQVQVRAPYTLAEARAGAVVTALAGPAYSLGDDLTTLPAERLALALDPVVLDVAGGPAPARAIGIMDTATREAPQSPLLEQFREPVGLVTLPASRFEVEGASGDHYAITVDWNGDHAVTVDTVQP